MPSKPVPSVVKNWTEADPELPGERTTVMVALPACLLIGKSVWLNPIKPGLKSSSTIVSVAVEAPSTAVGGIGERQSDGPIHIRHVVVEDRDGERLEGFVGSEHQGAVGGGVINSGHGGAVAGGKVHRHRVGGSNLAQHRDGDAAPVL